MNLKIRLSHDHGNRLASWVLFLTFQAIHNILNCDSLTLGVCRPRSLTINTQVHTILLFILRVLESVQVLVWCNTDHMQTFQYLKIFAPCIVIKRLKFGSTKCTHYNGLISETSPYFKPHSSNRIQCTLVTNNR
jgi:hypothetical protein